ncbi:winged helix-turn-helix domain-containing protein [Rhodococcus sp. USK10]|nr:winged helix-turn-helix domain-containing protein [Rhodococcus sp. USK10]
MSAAEITTWIRSVLRRVTICQPAKRGSPQELALIWEAGALERHEGRVLLTKTEFDIFAVLARSAGSVVSRRNLLLIVWGVGCESTTNVLNACMWSLRRKLVLVGAGQAIQTIRGVGFALREPVSIVA